MMRFIKSYIYLLLLLLCVNIVDAQETSYLPVERRMLFNTWSDLTTGNYFDSAWTHVGTAYVSPAPVALRRLLAGTNHTHTAGWGLTNCYAGNAYDIAPSLSLLPNKYSTPVVTTNYQASLQNISVAMIDSPFYTNGIGTIYFDAINQSATQPTEVMLRIATNMLYLGSDVTNIMMSAETAELKYNWITLTNITLAATTASNFIRYRRLLNYRGRIKFRIERTGTVYATVVTAAMTQIDSICVSPPPADVVIRKPEVVFNPGYPMAGSNLTIRCFVDNLDLNVPTTNTNRTLTVWYRWRYLNQITNAWTNALMNIESVGYGNGNNERWAKALPIQSAEGDLEYYFTCTFEGYRYKHLDYTQAGYTDYPTEWLSPRTLRGGTSEPDGREYYVRLRPFKSQYESVWVVADPQVPAPVEMMLTGDNEWRGMVRINNGSITNLNFVFKAIKGFISGTDTFDTNIVYWVEQSQSSVGQVPYGGHCVATNSATPRIRVTVDTGGYVQIIFNTQTLDFMTCRAEYQNFNLWTAPVDTFTESGGQATKQYFPNSFDSWPTNQSDVFNEDFIGSASVHPNYSPYPFTTFNGWQVGSGIYVEEQSTNVALRLKGGSAALGLGYIYNNVATSPDGVQEISFKCRLGQPISAYEATYYINGFTNKNYAVKVDLKADAGISPEKPSLSIIGYYQGPNTFYEYRMTQILTNQVMLLELYKWNNGTPYVLTSTYTNTILTTKQFGSELRLFSSKTNTQIRCSFGSTDNVLLYNDSGTGVDGTNIQSGTYGFLSADCRAGFSLVRTQSTTNNADTIGSASIILNSTNAPFSNEIGNWYKPFGRFEGNTNTAICGLYSIIPTQSLGVYLQPNNGSAPYPAGTLNWTNILYVPFTNFSYVSRTIPLNQWHRQFVMLRVEGRDDPLNVDVAVDELSVASWHGQTKSDSGTASATDWVATEAWVVTNATSAATVVHLNHSRGDPSKDQAIRSLLLTNGIGSLEFDYKVLSAPAKLTVQYARQEDDTMWTDIQSVTVSNVMAGYEHMLVYAGMMSTNGYLRVLNVLNDYTNAWVEINNIMAWDEPTIASTSWRAYNAKITKTDTMRTLLDESVACFLNNSTTQDADPIQNLYVPYVQSPYLTVGVGKISFMARAYSNGIPATISIYAQTNNYWGAIPITNIVASSNLYQRFSFKPSYADGRKYSAIRFVTGTTSVHRVCLEEISIAEPFFSSFDIVNITPLCKNNGGAYEERYQPLDSDEVGIRAQIANIQLAPSNIQMRVSYYVGTNVWGINNWPAGEVRTLPMTNTIANPTIYQTSPFNDIPFLEKDFVVQYYVWATFEGDGISFTNRQQTFNSPAWYFPVNLNQTYVAKGWSPYYIVYGVPMGAVWINEINAYDNMTTNVPKMYSGMNPYIEIAVPAGIDLAGWKIDLVKTSGAKTVITLPSGLAPKSAVTNGYAFYVIGESVYTRNSSIPPLDKMDYGYSYLSTVMQTFTPGGIRLRRPLGMYEHTVVYDWDPTILGAQGSVWATKDTENKFFYVGREYSGGSLNVTNGTGAFGPSSISNNWCFPLAWTPGMPNIGQDVPNVTLLPPGVSNVIISSTMPVDYGTQNGLRTTPLMMKIRKGSTTNINYKANDWYRINSVKVNGSELFAIAEEQKSYNLPLPNVQTNITIQTSISLKKDVADLNINGEVLRWLLKYNDTLPLVSSFNNGREMDLTELYWLDADPTKTNYLRGGFVSWDIPMTNEYNHVTVFLSLSNSVSGNFNVTNLQGNSMFKIGAKKTISDLDWVMLAQYKFNAASFDTTNRCHVLIYNPYLFPLSSWDKSSLVLWWVIEMEDPRVYWDYLTDEP